MCVCDKCYTTPNILLMLHIVARCLKYTLELAVCGSSLSQFSSHCKKIKTKKATHNMLHKANFLKLCNVFLYLHLLFFCRQSISNITHKHLHIRVCIYI